MARLIEAAGYVRMSTDKQYDSPVQQRDAITAYAKEHGFKIVAWYSDKGASSDATDTARKRSGVFTYAQANPPKLHRLQPCSPTAKVASVARPLS